MNPTDPDSYDWGDTSAEQIRAHLDPLKDWDAMTDEERAQAAKGPHRRDVLGSLDETHALNRHERDRGATDARNLLAVVGFALVLGVQVLAFRYPVIALWSLGLIALWVAVAIPLAFVVARRIGGAR